MTTTKCGIALGAWPAIAMILEIVVVVRTTASVELGIATNVDVGTTTSVEVGVNSEVGVLLSVVVVTVTTTVVCKYDMACPDTLIGPPSPLQS